MRLRVPEALMAGATQSLTILHQLPVETRVGGGVQFIYRKSTVEHLIHIHIKTYHFTAVSGVGGCVERRDVRGW